jgi:hypothetical protein
MVTRRWAKAKVGTRLGRMSPRMMRTTPRPIMACTWFLGIEGRRMAGLYSTAPVGLAHWRFSVSSPIGTSFVGRQGIPGFMLSWPQRIDSECAARANAHQVGRRTAKTFPYRLKDSASSTVHPSEVSRWRLGLGLRPGRGGRGRGAPPRRRSVAPPQPICGARLGLSRAAG